MQKKQKSRYKTTRRAVFYTLTYTHTLLRRAHELGRAPRTNHKDGRCSLLALRLSCTLIGHAYIAPGAKAPGFTLDGGMKTGQLSLLMEPSVLTSHTAGTSTNLLNEQNLRNSDARSAETAGPGGGRHLHQVCLGQAVTATRSAPGAGPGLSSLHSEPLQPTSHAGRRARAAGADGLSSEGRQLALCGRRLTLPGQRDLSHTPLTGQGLPTCPLYPLYGGDAGPPCCSGRVFLPQALATALQGLVAAGPQLGAKVEGRRGEDSLWQRGVSASEMLRSLQAHGHARRPAGRMPAMRRGAVVTREPSGPATASSTPGSPDPTLAGGSTSKDPCPLAYRSLHSGRWQRQET